MHRKISLIGASIDACAGTVGSADTPDTIKNTTVRNLDLSFKEIFYYKSTRHDIPKLQEYFTQIADFTKLTLQQLELPIVIGGDHSCAIGTWSGAADYLRLKSESLGIIWFDAHMDSHTPQSSLSGNIHGMPIATLLGYGYNELINILNNNPKIKPEHIILIGIRSFEEAEKNLLDQLGVKIYYNYDVNKYGIDHVFKEAFNTLDQLVDNIGLSVDLDGFDPKDAPGVGTKEADGIDFNDFLVSLNDIDTQKVIVVEITEGNAHFDPSGKTMRCITDIINKIKLLECNLDAF